MMKCSGPEQDRHSLSFDLSLHSGHLILVAKLSLVLDGSWEKRLGQTRTPTARAFYTIATNSHLRNTPSHIQCNIHVHTPYCEGCTYSTYSTLNYMYMYYTTLGVFPLGCSSAVCGGCIPETTISRLTLGYIKPVRPEQLVHTQR